MFVNEVNEVKIYNLSAGKSVPEWLTDRRKRSRLMNKIDSRRHIELIQDFNMPTVCTSIRISPNQEYILATGTYKPRVKCFEVCNLSIKFERCFDSEVTTFEVISDDYSKLVFLQCDRHLEIHSAPGRHYRLRIPRFGRDMKYHYPSCDMFIVGTSSEVYRLNLERGQFLQPFETKATCLNACEVSAEHGLLMVGSKEGTVEAWDPRCRTRCAFLDVAQKLLGSKVFPSVSTMKFKNGLQMAVGTNSGHVLLYDIRSKESLFIKDHLNKLPIKRLAFNNSQNVVYSLDDAILKLWDETSGKQVAYIESKSGFNDFATINDTGLLFLAQEDEKMLTYYIPAMGPAPRWCSFLDNLTEEIESEVVEYMYDDYQFVTQKELSELGLDHLIGSNLLKAYMHGYFMNVRLYNKIKAIVDPFAYDRYRKEKVREHIQNECKSRVQINTNLPKINQELALKIIDEQNKLPTKQRGSKQLPNLLQDERFKALFNNTDYVIDKNAEEYKLLAPALNRLEKSKLKEIERRIEVSNVAELHAEENQPHADSDNDEDLFNLNRSDDSSESEEAEASTDDENIKEFSKEMKSVYKEVKKQRMADDNMENTVEQQQIGQTSNTTAASTALNHSKITNYEMITLQNTNSISLGLGGNNTKAPLADRLVQAERMAMQVQKIGNKSGERQMNFKMRKPLSREMKKREQEMKSHRIERQKLIRPMKSVKLKKLHLKY